MAISGFLVPQMDKAGGWDASLIGMGIVAALLAMAAIILAREHDPVRPVTAMMSPSSGTSGLKVIRPLCAACFF